jgi:hypothetical protein
MGLFIKTWRGLKAIGIQEKSKLSLLLQVGKGFQIRPYLRSFIARRFWHSKRPN